MKFANRNLPKLTVSIDALIASIDARQEITPEQALSLVAFMRRHLPKLRTFAADIEMAQGLSGGLSPAITCAAASKLYNAMAAPAEPLLAERPHVAPVICLDRFRRPPAEGGAR